MIKNVFENIGPFFFRVLYFMLDNNAFSDIPHDVVNKLILILWSYIQSQVKAAVTCK